MQGTLKDESTSGNGDRKKQCPTVYHVVEGLHVSRLFSERIMKSAMSYRPRDDDVFVASYPKCGSTWLQQIVNGVLKSVESSPAESGKAWRQEVPAFLDFEGAEGARSMRRPGCLKTHLPYGKHPYSPEAKYICITRNPYDCCVSFYYHTRRLPTYRFQEGTFDQFFDMFLDGKVDYGDYFDHLLSWYAHHGDPNLLFITYEGLKKDTTGWVLRIADFLSKEKYGGRIRKHPELLEQVLVSTSVESMKSLNSTLQNWTGLIELVPAAAKEEFMQEMKDVFGDIWHVQGNADFVRKGIVGDWKAHFNTEQIRRMKDRIEYKTRGSDVMELWKDVGLP
ncbi:hypothetical protein HPB50_016483 [Hyalomma asiaticum]|uniref:Uncharacterized protein n=1 Tax=Hyalomma asiaticum TaxID=266040 RepID=A0ACB7RVS0_HYAAI|nr:hypothetical protein HPB50_016483 [Hyalomma asiaticum]